MQLNRDTIVKEVGWMGDNQHTHTIKRPLLGGWIYLTGSLIFLTGGALHLIAVILRIFE